MPETALTELAVYRARPTVRIDTREYPKVSELITAMRLTEQEGGMSALELRVSNVASDPQGGADLAFEDGAALRLGATIVVYSGDEASPQEIFQGKITGLEAEFVADGSPEMVVLAEDVFQQARMARRTKVHRNVSIADLARDLAKEIGLDPVITGFTSKIGTHVQLDQSDLAFFRSILSRYDGDVQVVGSELHVSPRGEVKRGALELALHGQLHRARVLADLSHQVTEITVTGWDALRGQRVTGRSKGANSGPGSGQKGSKVLVDSIGERSHHIAHLAVTTDAEARAIAEAAFDARARRFVCVEGTAEGNPSLRVGTHVRLTGMGPRFDNVYYVVWACHRFDMTHGYETDFEGECAYWGGG